MDWARAYGGSHYDGATSILQTPTGDFILTGWTYSGGAGGEDVLLVKIDAEGEVQWSQTYGGTGNEACLASLQTTDGNFFLAGHTSSIGAGKSDFMLLKLSADYQPLWVRPYGGSDYDIAHSLIQTSDDGFILVGATRSGGAGGQDALLVKTDAMGEVQWMQTYGGSGWEDAYSIIPTTDGGFALVGGTKSYSSGGSDAWLVKIDNLYQQQWIWTYGGTEDDGFSSILQTADGGFILAGYTRSYGAGYWDALLVKIKSNGQVEWSKTYGAEKLETVVDLIQTDDGGYALISKTISYGSGSSDFWLVKTDANGNMEWDETYGGSDADNIFAGLLAADGGFALAGMTYSYGSGDSDAWLVKTPSFATTTTTTGGITFVTMTKPVYTLSIATPVMSFTVDPKPLLTPSTYTTEPESPLNFTAGPNAPIEFETTFNTAITFTAGPITGFETTTSPKTTTSAMTTSTTSVPVTVTVTDTETETETETEPTPGFISFPTLLGLLVVVLIFRKRRT